MRFFDMFSGIGGFHKGISKAIQNAECVGFSEIDKHAIYIYEKHFKGIKNYGDATKINPDEIGDFDMLCGGFPCQSFSIAGKRQGFQDIRGTLFAEIVRIAKAKRPRFLFLENVPGLLNHDGGETFATILHSFHELGYNLEWQVLNSKNFEVPQNRERVFIIGHLRTESTRQIFPLGKSDKGNIESQKGVNGEGQRIRCDVASCLVQSNGGNNLIVLNKPNELISGSQGARVYGIDGTSVTISSEGGGMGAKTGLYAIPVLTPDRSEKRQNGRRFKEDGEPSFTITAQDRHGIYDGTKIRRLTPLECERLQGFPDGWTDGLSDTQRYKCLGNAVTVNVIEAIANKIKVSL